SAVNVITTAATSAGATLPSAPVSGNIIVYICGIDKSVSGITPPSGFTSRVASSAASVALIVATKVSDGSETGTISASWTTARMSKGVVFELEASGGATIGYDTRVVTNPNTPVTSQATGTIATTATAATYGIVIAAKDSAKAT